MIPWHSNTPLLLSTNSSIRVSEAATVGWKQQDLPISITVVGQFACAMPVPGLHWHVTWVYMFPFPMMKPPDGFLLVQLMHWFLSVKWGLDSIVS